jgi:hypothetical protein
MDTTTFLQSVLGTAGSYCVLALNDGRRIQKFYDTIEQLEQAALNFDENGFDAYYALGTFEEAGSREAENVKQMRAFFMDLDCGVNLKTGKPKDFPDQHAAILALKEFVKTTGLPKPFLVNSGYGVHVYWPLTAPVDFMAWLRVAEKLKALAKAKGFKADEAVTAARQELRRTYTMEKLAGINAGFTVEDLLKAFIYFLDGNPTGDINKAGSKFLQEQVRLSTHKFMKSLAGATTVPFPHELNMKEYRVHMAHDVLLGYLNDSMAKVLDPMDTRYYHFAIPPSLQATDPATTPAKPRSIGGSGGTTGDSRHKAPNSEAATPRPPARLCAALRVVGRQRARTPRASSTPLIC